MKRLFTLLAMTAAAATFSSCGGEETTLEVDAAATPEVSTEAPADDPEPGLDLTVSVPEIPATYAERDLSEFGLGAHMMIPEGSEVYTSVLITGQGEQNQIVVQPSTEGPRLHLWKSSKDLETAKSEIKGNTINEFQTFVMEDDHSAVYHAKKNIDDTNTFNFIYVIDNNGETWHAKAESSGFNALSKDDAMMLYAMAGSIHDVH